MIEREFEQRLRGYVRSEVAAAGAVPAELRESVWAIPDAVVPAGAGVFRTRRGIVLLAAAAMLLALLVGGAIAVGSGLIPWLASDEELNVPGGVPWVDQPATRTEAGTYYLDLPGRAHIDTPPSVRVTFELPGGWERVRVDNLIWGNEKWLNFGVADNLYVDPCRSGLGVRRPPVGPTAADMAAALTGVPGWRVTAISDVTVDGFSGKRVELVGPADSSSCTGRESRLLHVTQAPYYVPALRDNEPVTLWILNVESTRLVIRAGHETWAASSRVSQLQDVVDSVQIQPLLPASDGDG